MSTLALPVDTVPHYNDGPSTPLLEQAERAYRDGFRQVASAAASWKHPPEDLRESLWRARREVRRRHKVLVPSSPMVAIVRAATSAGLSERKAGRLLKQAESQGMVHRWRFGANQPVRFATVAQPRPPG